MKVKEEGEGTGSIQEKEQFVWVQTAHQRKYSVFVGTAHQRSHGVVEDEVERISQ